MLEDIIDYVKTSPSLDQEFFDNLKDILYDLNKIGTVSSSVEGELKSLQTVLSSKPTEHEKRLNLSLYTISRILNPSVIEDKSNNVSRRDRQKINSLLDDIFDKLQICISPIPIEIMKELDERLSEDDLEDICLGGEIEDDIKDLMDRAISYLNSYQEGSEKGITLQALEGGGGI